MFTTFLYVFILIEIKNFQELTRPLREAADEIGILIGAAVNSDPAIINLPEYRSANGNQMNVITSENGCKWQYIEPTKNNFDYQYCDAAEELTRNYSQLFRGHALCWHIALPSWLEFGSFNKSEKREILINHIQKIVSHYDNKIYAWDVVNEAFYNNGILRNSTFYPDIPDFINVSFSKAREFDSSAKLFYNDFEADIPNSKSDAIYEMVKKMKNGGIPINGVGFQMHLSTPDSAVAVYSGGYYYIPDDELVYQNFKRFIDLGLEVQITEFDVSTNVNCTINQTCLDEQKEIYKKFLNVCLALYPACTAFITWGISDKYNWLDWITGSRNLPLPFDDEMKPKPAAFGMLEVLEDYIIKNKNNNTNSTGDDDDDSDDDSDDDDDEILFFAIIGGVSVVSIGVLCCCCVLLFIFIIIFCSICLLKKKKEKIGEEELLDKIESE